jgi:conjugal transfer mating pair stabilization protein TraG
MSSVYAAYDLAAAADLGTGAKALSLQTASTIYSRAISGEAVVGYLAISIPLIAWAALKRMENFGTALVGGLTGLQGTLAGSTGGTAIGNVSMGNVSMDQQNLAPNRTSAFMRSWQSDLTGNTLTSSMLTGRTAARLLRNEGFASRVVSVRVSEQDVTEASRMADAARYEMVAAGNERSALLTEAMTKGVAKVRATRSSSGTTSSSFEELGQTLNRLDQVTQSVANSTGLSQNQVARIAFGASAQLGLKTAVAGAQVEANADKTYLSGLTADQRKVLGSMSSEQLADFKQFGERVSRDASLLALVATDARSASEIGSRLSHSATRLERSQAAYSDRTALAERLVSARERGESISIDVAQDPHNLAMFLRYAQQHGGDSTAALTLLDAELARQAPRPTRTLSDGVALPASFQDIRARHDVFSGSIASQPTLETTDLANRDTVRSAALSGAPSQASEAAPSRLTVDVAEGGQKIRSLVSAERRTFDKEAEVTTAADGTVSSKKSLLLQSGRQVAQDATSIAAETKNAVSDLLKRK